MEGFSTMQSELEAEKNAMNRIWRKRERQLMRMSAGVASVVDELQGFGQGCFRAWMAVAALTLIASGEEEAAAA